MTSQSKNRSSGRRRSDVLTLGSKFFDDGEKKAVIKKKETERETERQREREQKQQREDEESLSLSPKILKIQV